MKKMWNWRKSIRKRRRVSAAWKWRANTYNPAGRKRRHLLEEALRIFRNQRGGKTLCAYVKHAGRPAQRKWVGTVSYTHLDVYKRQVIRKCGVAPG